MADVDPPRSRPDELRSATFPLSRKGFDPKAVRSWLAGLADELERAQVVHSAALSELAFLRIRASAPEDLDDDLLVRRLGEAAAQVLATARSAAAEIRTHAQDGAARLVREAADEAARLRERAELDVARMRQEAAEESESLRAEASRSLIHAESEANRIREDARAEGRAMVSEAKALRERMLADLIRRRDLALQQLERVHAGRRDVESAIEHARDGIDQILAVLAALEPERADDLETIRSPGAAVTVSASPDRPTSPPIARPVTIQPATMVPVAVVEPVPVVVAGPVAVAEPVPVVDPEAEVVAEPEAEVVAEPEAEVVAEPEAEVVAEPEAEVVAEPEAEVVAEPEPVRAKPLRSADDLFARIRSARTTDVARQAEPVLPVSEPTDVAPAAEPTDVAPVAMTASPGGTGSGVVTMPNRVLAPAGVDARAVMVSRAAILDPLVVSATRRLKRVLADELNAVLDQLRRPKADHSVEAMVGSQTVQIEIYLHGIDADLRDGALAGATELAGPVAPDHPAVEDARARAAAEVVGGLVRPLRERLAAAVEGVDADTAGERVRALYREAKTTRVEAVVVHALRVAFGAGGLGAAAGRTVCWVVDPDAPPCADAEDNALAGAISAGTAFPTGHTGAPAYPGCRCAVTHHPD